MVPAVEGSNMNGRVDWLQVTRALTQFVVPVLIAAAFIVEMTGVTPGLSTLEVAYDYLIAIVFSLLTVVMISVCGWIVLLWDIDRLFFRLERRSARKAHRLTSLYHS